MIVTEAFINKVLDNIHTIDLNLIDLALQNALNKEKNGI